MSEFDAPPPQTDVPLFIERDGDYRKKKREDRMRKRGVSDEHDITQPSAVADGEEYITAELKRTKNKEQAGEPERPKPQSFFDKFIKRKNQVMVYLIGLPRINL